MICTTNFSSIWKLPKGMVIVAITQGNPDININLSNVYWDKSLAPTWDIKKLADQKKYAKFEKRYKEEILSQVNLADILAKYGPNVAFVCFCKKGDFCHRRVLAQCIEEELKIKVKEM